MWKQRTNLAALWGSQKSVLVVRLGLPFSIWDCLAGRCLSMGIHGLVNLGCVQGTMGHSVWGGRRETSFGFPVLRGTAAPRMPQRRVLAMPEVREVMTLHGTHRFLAFFGYWA